jgi:phosphoketolase
MRKQRALEQEQQPLKEQTKAELLQQQMMAMQQQQEFDERQRLQAEQQRLAGDQFHRQAQGHAAELERQLLELKGQQNNNLLLLKSYDNVRCVRNMLMYLRANLELESESFGK